MDRQVIYVVLFVALSLPFIIPGMGFKMPEPSPEVRQAYEYVENLPNNCREEGVKAMHDATECGVLGGVYEMAEASGVGVILYKDKIPVQEGVLEICKLFGMEPYSSISEGTLVIAAVPDKADEIVRRLKNKGIDAEIVGEFIPRERGMWVVESGEQKPLEHPRVDPFWSAIDEALKRGLS
ncbi:MAG: AIR synthase-related protein [candidate division WOR-3 bacterium]